MSWVQRNLLDANFGQDVPAYHVAAGNPARILRKIECEQADEAEHDDADVSSRLAAIEARQARIEDLLLRLVATQGR